MAGPAPHVAPRALANKSAKNALAQAIRLTLELETSAVRHNTQTFNRARYRATAEIDDYEALKDRARQIKERAIADLPALLAQLERSVVARGGHFCLARDAAEACGYIESVCRRHQARMAVKAKSMTAEEIKLNAALERAGIEVVETDLAEFILQAADEHPSHLIAPAIHYTRERITELFKRKFTTDLPLDTGEELTRFAQQRLRAKFLRADVGISGANAISADSGTLLLVESEGNIRMVTLAPPVHIAVAGVEKVVPRREDLAVIVELLAPSATGQPLTSYTSIIRPPLDVPAFSFGERKHTKREFHLVLLDNGRLRMREDPILREALYCIRCSACLNSCANFQVVGGHAFGGETYSGGIGGAWEAGTGKLENARFSELCTGCSRCLPQCPVRIDVSWLNSVLRAWLNQGGRPDDIAPGTPSDRRAPLQKRLFAHYHRLAECGSRLAPLSNWVANLVVSRLLLEKVAGVDWRRPLPRFSRSTLVQRYREFARRKAAHPGKRPEGLPARKVALFADVYTNYGHPHWGLALLEVFEAIGVDVVLCGPAPEGRAALSQGLLETAAQQARRTAEVLAPFLAEGRDVVVIEPSALAMFRLDYRHLLDDRAVFEKLRAHSFDPIEYISRIVAESGLPPRQFFQAERLPGGKAIFYHAHCQQKTIGAAQATEKLLRAIGFDVVISEAECCGMAGSFGYKKDFAELSVAVGEVLGDQIKRVVEQSGPRTLVASGTSCHEQLRASLHCPVLHPIEVLRAALATSRQRQE